MDGNLQGVGCISGIERRWLIYGRLDYQDCLQCTNKLVIEYAFTGEEWSR
jgi:hypothetical protein